MAAMLVRLEFVIQRLSCGSSARGKHSTSILLGRFWTYFTQGRPSMTSLVENSMFCKGKSTTNSPVNVRFPHAFSSTFRYGYSQRKISGSHSAFRARPHECNPRARSRSLLDIVVLNIRSMRQVTIEYARMKIRDIMPHKDVLYFSQLKALPKPSTRVRLNLSFKVSLFISFRLNISAHKSIFKRSRSKDPRTQLIARTLFACVTVVTSARLYILLNSTQSHTSFISLIYI